MPWVHLAKGPRTQWGEAALELSSLWQGLSLCVESRALPPSSQTGGHTCGDTLLDLTLSPGH